jgi:hypothetical protein
MCDLLRHIGQRLTDATVTAKLVTPLLRGTYRAEDELDLLHRKSEKELIFWRNIEKQSLRPMQMYTRASIVESMDAGELSVCRRDGIGESRRICQV